MDQRYLQQANSQFLRQVVGYYDVGEMWYCSGALARGEASCDRIRAHDWIESESTSRAAGKILQCRFGYVMVRWFSPYKAAVDRPPLLEGTNNNRLIVAMGILACECLNAG